jgi:hypothetical protein
MMKYIMEFGICQWKIRFLELHKSIFYGREKKWRIMKGRNEAVGKQFLFAKPERYFSTVPRPTQFTPMTPNSKFRYNLSRVKG